MDDLHEDPGFSQVLSPSVSRPIPISRTRTAESSSSARSSPNFARSAPAPRAPVIGSLRTPSYLGVSMPLLELPPQSTSISGISERGGEAGHNYAQSAPNMRFLTGSKKTILHALKIRDRADSRASSLGEGDVGDSGSLKHVGDSGSLKRRISGSSHRVSFEETHVVRQSGREALFEEALAHKEEEEEEEGQEKGDEEEETGNVEERDSDLIDSMQYSSEPQNMLVFSAMRSLSLTDPRYLSSKMAAELSENEQTKQDPPPSLLQSSILFGDSQAAKPVLPRSENLSGHFSQLDLLSQPSHEENPEPVSPFSREQQGAEDELDELEEQFSMDGT